MNPPQVYLPMAGTAGEQDEQDVWFFRFTKQ